MTLTTIETLRKTLQLPEGVTEHKVDTDNDTDNDRDIEKDTATARRCYRA